jgi:hypothetical protein
MRSGRRAGELSSERAEEDESIVELERLGPKAGGRAANPPVSMGTLAAPTPRLLGRIQNFCSR